MEDAGAAPPRIAIQRIEGSLLTTKYEFNGPATAATVSGGGTTVTDTSTAVFEWLKDSLANPQHAGYIRLGDTALGRVYYKFNSTTCTRATSDGYLSPGEQVNFATEVTKVAILNSSGGTIQIGTSATKELWVGGWV